MINNFAGNPGYRPPVKMTGILSRGSYHEGRQGAPGYMPPVKGEADVRLYLTIFLCPIGAARAPPRRGSARLRL